MSYGRSVAHQHTPVEVLNPATDAAGRTGKWIHTTMAAKLAFVVHITQGAAATVLLSVLQATSNAGANSKAIASTVKVWANLDTSTSDALVAQADAVSFTTDAALKNKIVVIEVEASQLDLANGFDHITISTGASNVANITQAELIPLGMRYPGLTPPTTVD